MKLKRSTKDPNVAENEMGDPIIRFVGLHPSDFDRVIDAGESKIDKLEFLIDDIREIIDDPYSTPGEKISGIKNLL